MYNSNYNILILKLFSKFLGIKFCYYYKELEKEYITAKMLYEKKFKIFIYVDL